jgi:hypothetical protein
VLDVALGTPGSALEVFVPRWTAFRGTPAPIDVDDMAAAILAGDVPRLGESISGADAVKIRIGRNRLPLELRRRPKGSATLLDVAAAVGGAPLRYLLEFFGLKPTIETLHQAVATGEPDLIRTIWDRLPLDVREAHIGELALTAADFHHLDVANWLLIDAKRSAHLAVRRFAEEHRLLDILLRLPEVSQPRGIFTFGAMADEFEDELVEWVWLKARVTGRLASAIPVGVKRAELLLAKGAGPWDFGEFKAKVVGKAPFVVLVEFAGGVCGGFAAVPFEGSGWIADRTGTSFVFSLRPTAGRYPLKNKAEALFLSSNFFSFRCLLINNGGDMLREELPQYAVPSGWKTGRVKFARFEVWRVTL